MIRQSRIDRYFSCHNFVSVIVWRVGFFVEPLGPHKHRFYQGVDLSSVRDADGDFLRSLARRRRSGS